MGAMTKRFLVSKPSMRPGVNSVTSAIESLRAPEGAGFSRPSASRRTLGTIDEKRRDAVEKEPHRTRTLGRHGRLAHCLAHQLHPAIARPPVDTERRVPGPQPRMPPLLEIANWPAESIDQKIPKPCLGACQIL